VGESETAEHREHPAACSVGLEHERQGVGVN
jgi:hypothetical protein